MRYPVKELTRSCFRESTHPSQKIWHRLGVVRSTSSKVHSPKTAFIPNMSNSSIPMKSIIKGYLQWFGAQAMTYFDNINISSDQTTCFFNAWPKWGLEWDSCEMLKSRPKEKTFWLNFCFPKPLQLKDCGILSRPIEII